MTYIKSGPPIDYIKHHYFLFWNISHKSRGSDYPGLHGRYDNPDHNSTMHQTVAEETCRKHNMGQNEDQFIKIKED